MLCRVLHNRTSFYFEAYWAVSSNLSLCCLGFLPLSFGLCHPPCLIPVLPVLSLLLLIETLLPGLVHHCSSMKCTRQLLPNVISSFLYVYDVFISQMAVNPLLTKCYFLYRLPKLFNFCCIQALLFLLQHNFLKSRDYDIRMYSLYSIHTDTNLKRLS